MMRLGRWLGPWADEERSPKRVSRRRAWIPAKKNFEAFVYRTRPDPARAILLLPGLHFLGPNHPQLDRLARILAHSGYLVMMPKLRAFMQLHVDPSIFDDAAAALRALTRLPDYPERARPDVMSVSFGSAAAIHLASCDEFARRIGRTLIFGGFADFHDTIRFSVSGRGSLPHDPLNRAVVYLNLLPFLQVPESQHHALSSAWLRFCEKTWGRPEMKEPNAYQAVARDLCGQLASEIHPLFLEGCSCGPNPEVALDRCDAALERAGARFAWLDPTPKLAAIRSRTYLIHGRDDDVIPYTEAARLAAGFTGETQAEVLITGLYSHTRKEDAGQHTASPWQEFKTLSRILRVLSGAK